MIAILIATAATSITLTEALADNRTYVYDDVIAPQVIQDDHGFLWPKMHVFAGRTYDGANVNPNRTKPWLTNGGLDNVRHTGKRILWIPEGTKIKLRTRRAVFPRSRKSVRRTYGWFPNGSLVAEFLYHDGRLFEIRSRKKTDGTWAEDEQITYFRPPGYQSVNNCVDCHRDIGGHAAGWAATVSGLERDGPKAFTPFVVGNGVRPVIRDDVKHLVEWE